MSVFSTLRVFRGYLSARVCMKREHEDTRFVDSISVVKALHIYKMIPWAVAGSGGFGEGIFHTRMSDFYFTFWPFRRYLCFCRSL